MSKTIKIGFVQLNNGFAGQHYLPLAVGMLASTLKKQSKFTSSISLLKPIIFFDNLNSIVNLLSVCDIVALSVYVWNEQASLAIARNLKLSNPNIVIIFGGPQVPNSRKQFRRIRTKDLNNAELVSSRSDFTRDYHLQNHFIDYCIHGEGEVSFVHLIDAIIEKGKNAGIGLPSVSGLDERNRLIYPFNISRLNRAELTNYTGSPILDGYFDIILATYPLQRWALMYETDRGCPYQCTYCDWGGATEDKVVQFDIERIEQEIEWIGRNKIEYVFLCNANFGILKRDIDIARIFVRTAARFGFPKFVSTQNAKNPKDHTIEALKILHDGGLNKAAVMSQQSLNEETLRLVRRDNMDLEEYYQIQTSLASQGVFTMTDLIFPMPAETEESFKTAIDVLVSKGQYNRIQFNNLSILINTEMGNPEYQTTHGFSLRRVPIINPHGKRIPSDTSTLPIEMQTLVVGTKTMPVERWVKVRAFAWMFNFLFFNKILQIPLILCSKVTGRSISSLIDSLAFDAPHNSPIRVLLTSFENYAEDIAYAHGNEFIFDENALGIYWPPDELAFIESVRLGNLNDLYYDSELILQSCMTQQKNQQDYLVMLNDSVKLNKFLLRVPKQYSLSDGDSISLNYDIYSWYRNILKGSECLPVSSLTSYQKPTDIASASFELWCRDVVWYGNRRGDYLAVPTKVEYSAA